MCWLDPSQPGFLASLATFGKSAKQIPLENLLDKLKGSTEVYGSRPSELSVIFLPVSVLRFLSMFQFLLQVVAASLR